METRPDLTPALERLLVAMTAHAGQQTGAPPLLTGDPAVIVVVALAAHGLSAASVRTLSPCASRVVVDGRRRTIELGLRPPFFLGGDAPSRLATLCHELLHLERDGLRDENRHAIKSHADLEEEARSLGATLLPRLEARDVLCLAHDGEVLLRAWRHRPTEQTAARAYDDDDVYLQPVRMRTPPDRRGGWW